MSTLYLETVRYSGEAVLADLDKLTHKFSLVESEVKAVQSANAAHLVYREQSETPRSTESLHLSIDDMRLVASSNITLVPYKNVEAFIREKMAKTNPFGVIAYSEASTHATPIYFSGRQLYIMDAIDNFKNEPLTLSNNLHKSHPYQVVFSSKARLESPYGARVEALCLLENTLHSSLVNALANSIPDESAHTNFRVPVAWSPFAHNSEALDLDSQDILLADGTRAGTYRERHIQEAVTIFSLSDGTNTYSVKETRRVNFGLAHEATRIKALAKTIRDEQAQVKRFKRNFTIGASTLSVLIITLVSWIYKENIQLLMPM